MQSFKNNLVASNSNQFYSDWNFLPDSILLFIFQYLSPKELLSAGLTCKTWLRVCYDNFLWKNLFYSHFKVARPVNILPGKNSWLQEFKRLTYHTPFIQTEVLTNHTHQVLHVNFAHHGKLFATCSKDGFILVWNSSYPASIKYYKDMKSFHWNYTQFCEFNQSDTLLLVSGVHFGMPHTISGEIAVFSLQDGFNLQCRVINKPYDIFGTWYNDHYLLSGDHHWLTHLYSSSVLWLNKASQETSSEHVPIMSQLCKFCNCNASSICAVMVANCLTSDKTNCQNKFNASKTSAPNEISNTIESKISYQKQNKFSKHQFFLNDGCESNINIETNIKSSSERLFDWKSLKNDLEHVSPIFYNEEYRKAELESHQSLHNMDDNSNNEHETSNEFNSKLNSEDDSDDEDSENEYISGKLLIFSTGSKTFTPHQIGFKKIKPFAFPKKMKPGPSLAERIAEKEIKNSRNPSRLETNDLDFDSVIEKFDKVDHLIDLNGHIIGMSLSPDHRYLYVNSRPWPQGCVIKNPLNPPPIAQEIDIHVIDLVTLKEVGTMLRAHKAYTPNNECFFIFLNVCKEYVASGAEDNHAYLWDRHYGICLAKYPHGDVVNSVAFNPKDSEMLVTTSDDFTIKIWRSKHRVKQLKIENGFNLPKCFEIYKKKKI